MTDAVSLSAKQIEIRLRILFAVALQAMLADECSVRHRQTVSKRQSADPSWAETTYDDKTDLADHASGENKDARQL